MSVTAHVLSNVKTSMKCTNNSFHFNRITVDCSCATTHFSLPSAFKTAGMHWINRILRIRLIDCNYNLPDAGVQASKWQQRSSSSFSRCSSSRWLKGDTRSRRANRNYILNSQVNHKGNKWGESCMIGGNITRRSYEAKEKQQLDLFLSVSQETKSRGRRKTSLWP